MDVEGVFAAKEVCLFPCFDWRRAESSSLPTIFADSQCSSSCSRPPPRKSPSKLVSPTRFPSSHPPSLSPSSKAPKPSCIPPTCRSPSLRRPTSSPTSEKSSKASVQTSWFDQLSQLPPLSLPFPPSPNQPPPRPLLLLLPSRISFPYSSNPSTPTAMSLPSLTSLLRIPSSEESRLEWRG